MNFANTSVPEVDAASTPVAHDDGLPRSLPRTGPESFPGNLDEMRAAQQSWAALPPKLRLRILRNARHLIASEARQIAATVPNELSGQLHRSPADTLVAEVLPLLDACRFLEREAAWILAPQQLGNRSLPWWLGGITTVVHRVPVGVVLILAPGNYPLFLGGVQVLQALAAGNGVLWKPAPGGAQVAHALRKILCAAGLNPCLIRILDETVEAGIQALALGADKVFLTGSATTGQTVLGALAETLTPSVMELSGCDAVFVLDDIGDGAEIDRAAHAIAFGMRFNGSSTCMAPRRLFATAAVTKHLLPPLFDQLSRIEPIPTHPDTVCKLNELIEDAIEQGAVAVLDGRVGGRSLRPTVLDNANPRMLATRTDIFAPLLSIIRVANMEEALTAHAQCAYALTASIFGRSDSAEVFATRVHAGNVVINDIIVSTADPRAPFGGRGASGFGVTRGREGLLEMTAVKTIQIQRSRSKKPYGITTPEHADFFLGIIHAFHGKGLRERWQGLRRIFRSAREIK